MIDYKQLKYLYKAYDFLENYISEIPGEVMHNICLTHKVSSGWLNNVGNLFALAHKTGHASDYYQNTFWDYVHGSGLRDRLTIKEDIEFTDKLLIEFLNELTTSTT